MIYYSKGYKYQLKRTHVTKTNILPSKGIFTEYIDLTRDGILTIRQGYAWDGASGPTWDTKSSMTGSLVHDALYQLMRMGLLERMWRYAADRLLQAICVKCKMFKWRARGWYRAVRLAARSSALPENKRKIYTAPS